MQPFASKTRAPASGSCDELNSGWASAVAGRRRSQATRIVLRTAVAIVLHSRQETRACREAGASPASRQRRMAPLLEREPQHARSVGVAYLRIVENRHAERVLLLWITELDVELAVRDEPAREHERPGPVLPRGLHGDVAAIPGERGHDDAGDLVAGLVLRIVERLLLGVDDPVRRRRLVALQGELRPRLVVADVVDVSTSGLRVTLAAGFRRLVLVVASGVEILVVELPYRAGPDALPVPDVGLLTRVGKIFVAVRLAFADMACGHASPGLEGG